MATLGRDFPNSKKASRKASEPMSSLVNEVEEPTLWTEGEGRWVGAGITEMAKLPQISGKMLCKILEKEGFLLDSTTWFCAILGDPIIDLY